MKLTSLLQLVDKLQQAGKIDVCGIFGCVQYVSKRVIEVWSDPAPSIFNQKK